MKLLPFMAVGFLIVMVNAMDPKEARDMFRNMSQECKEQEKATDEDVETMIDEKYPDSKEGKCLIACMQEQFGIVSSLKKNYRRFKSHDFSGTKWRVKRRWSNGSHFNGNHR